MGEVEILKHDGRFKKSPKDREFEGRNKNVTLRMQRIPWLTFAFAFKAFHPDGVIHSTAREDGKAPSP